MFLGRRLDQHITVLRSDGTCTESGSYGFFRVGEYRATDWTSWRTATVATGRCTSAKGKHPRLIQAKAYFLFMNSNTAKIICMALLLDPESSLSFPFLCFFLNSLAFSIFLFLADKISRRCKSSSVRIPCKRSISAFSA